VDATAVALRVRTATTHRAVEDTLALTDPDLTVERLAAVLTRLAGFWWPVEDLLDDWAGAGSRPDAGDDRPADLAAALEWPARRRGALLRADLAGLAACGVPGTDVVRAAPFTDRLDDAGALGWLYVAEGSTLGGAVLDRQLRPLLGAHDLSVSFFTPYPEGPGPRWKAYQQVLTTWVDGRDDRRRAVVDAADRAFAALAGWVQPLAVGRAA
jgi:heme oxygenase (biliverdin-IX-beta and delta-forming)